MYVQIYKDKCFKIRDGSRTGEHGNKTFNGNAVRLPRMNKLLQKSANNSLPDEVVSVPSLEQIGQLLVRTLLRHAFLVEIYLLYY